MRATIPGATSKDVPLKGELGTDANRRAANLAGDRLGPIAAFVRVVETGSFTAAASALGVSKSQVSRSVRTLEDRLGARLLHRTTRAVAPTEAGSAFYARCARILSDLEEAEEAVVHLQSAPRGTLRLSLPQSFGVRYLAPLIADFMVTYPEVRVEASFSERRVDLVDEGFDLAIRIGALDDSSLIVRKLGSTCRHVLASPGYLARRGWPKTPADLREHDCLQFTYQTSGTSWIFRDADQDVSVRVSGRLTANSGEALAAAACAGIGLVWLPDFLVADELRSGRLISVFGERPDPGLAIWAVYPHSRHLAPKVRLFVDMVAAHLGERPPWSRESEALSRS